MAAQSSVPPANFPLWIAIRVASASERSTPPNPNASALRASSSRPVTTTKTAVAATSLYGALVVFVAGGVLVAFAMVLSTRERVQEIGVLKAIGAANSELAGQFVAEALTLTLVAGVGALGVGVLAQFILQRTLGVMLHFDAMLFLLILGSALIFASLGSLYPIIHGIRVSPVEAMREE